MNSIASTCAATAFLFAFMFYPQVSFAETFDGKAFLGWSEDSQNSYIRTSVTMATFVATRTNPKMAECLDEWYAASEATSRSRHAFIREKISKNAEYHPSVVVLLMLEDACGSFER